MNALFGRRFIIIMLLTFSASSSFAESISLQWDASTSPDVNGYYLHYGLSSRQYTDNIDVGAQTQHTVPNLIVGNRYYFAVTAYDSLNDLESAFSSEVSITITSSSTSLLIDGFD